MAQTKLMPSLILAASLSVSNGSTKGGAVSQVNIEAKSAETIASQLYRTNSFATGWLLDTKTNLMRD